MKIIKLIIKWIINLLKKLFNGNKEINHKIKRTINNTSNNHYLKGYGNLNLNDESDTNILPLYLVISDGDKEKLINKLTLLEKKIDELNINEKDLIEIKKRFNNIKKHVKNEKISVYQEQKIKERIDNVMEEKKFDVDVKNTIITLDKDVIELLENYDKNIKEKVKKEYKVVNYVTITTLLLDETKREILKLEDDFRHHHYNKYYYERELNKIIERIEKLRKIRDNQSVKEEIILLRKELYTKTKDKYDLLYNDEGFLDLKKTCDDLLKKVNRRIIDLKKEKEEKEKIEKDRKKEEKKQEKERKNAIEDKNGEKELLENILRRFQDIELARKILFLVQKNSDEIKNDDDLLSYVNLLYLDFINGERCKFNYERNKVKLELVKFLNGINCLFCHYSKEEFIPFEHINFPMNDLIDYAITQKEQLELFLATKYDFKKEKNELGILVDNKLNILKEKEEQKDDKPHILIKSNENRS